MKATRYTSFNGSTISLVTKPMLRPIQAINLSYKTNIIQQYLIHSVIDFKTFDLKNGIEIK